MRELDSGDRLGDQPIVRDAFDHPISLDRTALMTALAGRYTEVVTRLLERGANRYHKDHLGLTPLSLAIAVEAPQLVELLAAGRGQEHKPLRVTASVLEAAAFESPALVRALRAGKLDKGATASLLVFAAAARDVALARELLADGVNANAADRTFKRNTLQHAVYPRPVQRTPKALSPAQAPTVLELVRLLLDAGADPNHRSHAGSPLIDAATYGASVDVIDALVRAGANLELADHNDDAPLMCALMWKQDAQARRLLVLGARVDTLEPRWRKRAEALWPVAGAAARGPPRAVS